MSSLEETFIAWSKGPNATEHAKCENAERAIRKAISAHPKLAAMDISVFPQGSYRNRTNVRQASDVDICVRLNSCFFEDYPSGTTRETFGNVAGGMPFSEYKNLVGQALEAQFGAKSVTRGNKAFKVHENTYRIDADVVAAFEHRRYLLRGDGSHYYLSGIGFDTDKSVRVTNWPEQNYANSLAKHEATGKRYRKLVRILKRARDVMQSEGRLPAKPVASCLIEALAWNVPNIGFNHGTFTEDVRFVLASVFNGTRSDEACKEWTEVNGIKYLFHPTQPWTRAEANEWVGAMWRRFGFQ